jgi:hypothetical protein
MPSYPQLRLNKQYIWCFYSNDAILVIFIILYLIMLQRMTWFQPCDLFIYLFLTQWRVLIVKGQDWLFCFHLSIQACICKTIVHISMSASTVYFVPSNLAKSFSISLFYARTAWFHFVLWAQPRALSLDLPCKLIWKFALKVWTLTQYM